MTQAQNVAELSSDINSSGVLQPAGGGTGLASPGTSGNVLTSTGAAWVSSAPAAFDTGTVMLFAQTAAPTGWTKNTSTGNNSALRVTTGTASSGGSVAFTTAFTSQTPTGTVSTTTGNTTATNQAITPSGSVGISSVSGSAGATTLSIPQMPSHSHIYTVRASLLTGFPCGGSHWANDGGAYTTAEGGSGAHTHPFSFAGGSGTFSGNSVTALQNAHNHTASSSFTGNAINLAVQYIDIIRATKD
jgi:hypothetical protein